MKAVGSIIRRRTITGLETVTGKLNYSGENTLRPGLSDSPVAHVLGAGAVHPDDDEHVLEVGADAPGGEGARPGLLEDDGHDVVPDVPLPQELRSGKGDTGVVTGGASAGAATQTRTVPASLRLQELLGKAVSSLKPVPPGVAQDERAGGLQEPWEESLNA